MGTPSEHGRLGRIRAATPANGVFAKLGNLDFLQACTLLHTREVRATRSAEGKTGSDLPPLSCQREVLLALPLAAYRKHAASVEKGFVEAARFLNQQHVLWGQDVPYPSQIVALAALFAVLGSKSEYAEWRTRLALWYWSGVLGEHYGAAVETKIARDVGELESWLAADGAVPRTMFDCVFQADRLLSLRTRGSAAYKGFHALMMRSGCRDFLSGKSVELMTVYQDPIDVHHVFPVAWCEKQGIAPGIYNSIVNKTPMAAATNRAMLRGDAPSVYLARIEERSGLATAALDELLASHLIDPALLRTDDFDAFFADRKARLAALASTAMGKAAIAGSPDSSDLAIEDDDTTLDEADTLELA